MHSDYPKSAVNYLRTALLCVAGIFACTFGKSANASLIISDNFTAADATALIGRLAAPTDTTGATYAGNGNVSTVGGITGGSPDEADVQTNMAHLGGDAGVALNLGIASAAQFQLSISFNINADTQTQSSNPRRGAALGFFSSVALGSSGASHGYNNFTGLVVDRLGSVRLIVAGADSGVATTVAGFDPAVTHTLVFSTNTAAGVGSISNVLLDGGSVSLTAPVDTFTVARSALGGFYNSSGVPADVGFFDNLTIATVPEPNALAVVDGVALLVCTGELWTRRRHRAKA